MTEDISKKIEEFFGQYRLRKYSKGQVLILNGDKSSNVYYLVKGKVKQYDVSYRGDELILNVFKPPAFFPMSLAINKNPSPQIYEAESDIEVRQAPAKEAVEFIKTNPDVMLDLLSRLYRGVDGVLGRMAQLMSTNARSRLVYELLLEARRFGKMSGDGSCLLNISEKDLGARAGLSRETVSREVSKLKSEGYLKVQAKAIIIKNLNNLEEKFRDQ